MKGIQVTKTYNIHGFVISVEGIANREFYKEYWWAVTEENLNPNLIVRSCGEHEDLPTKPAGCKKGFYIPFGERENVLLYQEGIPLNVLLSYCEGLFWWPDKSILHAGGVCKDSKAFIFTGGGNVGKTTIVLKLLKHGFEYLSDDWLVVDCEKAYPMPKTIHVFDYNFKDKEIANRILGAKKFLYKPYFSLLEYLREHFPHRYVRYGLEILKPMFHANLNKINPDAKIGSPTRISRIFFLERSNSVNKIYLNEDVQAEELARRAMHINLYEWNFVYREYSRYAYLFGIKNEKFEKKPYHEYEILYNAFKRNKVIQVIIPHKMDLSKEDIISLLELET
jgi:hypothetical protein